MALFPTFGAQVMPALSNNSDSLLQLGAGLLGGRNAQEQLAGGVGGFAQSVGQAKQRNRTAATLRAAGYGDLADGIENGSLSGADAFKLFYAQKLEAQKPKNNFMAVGKNLYNAETGEWVTPPTGIAASDEEWGLTPVWGESNGKTVLGQVSKTGKFKPLDTGDFNPTPVIQNVDTGTAILGRNSRTGQVVTTTPKDVAGAANQAGLGKAQSDAAAALLPAKQIASQIDQQIAELKADPSLPDVLGPIDSRTPNFRSGSIRAQAKIDQLKGGSFLSARQMLKGGGPITDFEGKKADAAVARMEQAQDVKDFNAALDDFNDAVQSGVQKLQMQAGGNFGVQSAPAGAGKTSSGISFSVEP